MKGKLMRVITAVKNWFLGNRTLSLLLFASGGGGLAIACYFTLDSWSHLKSDLPQLFSSLVLLCLALPTTFLLWLFRTHDVKRQIEEAQENNKLSRLNKNFNDFSNALKLFGEKDNLQANTIGLKLLMGIRQQGLYVE